MLVTTLTKRMAEELTEYYGEHGVRVRYLHSDIETIERTEIIRELREGVFDVLVGINLLREGLDIPEVSLVAILDADKEGFLRSHALADPDHRPRRAQRERHGDPVRRQARPTRSSARWTRRIAGARSSVAYNAEHGITPQTVKKRISSLRDSIWEADYVTVPKREERPEPEVPAHELPRLIDDLRREMQKAAKALDYERAAELRDRIRALEAERLGSS